MIDRVKKDWKRALIGVNASILEAIQKIEDGSLQIAIVTDEVMKLHGLVTDGDIRRGILNGIPMTAPVSEIMNSEPKVADIGDPISLIVEMMRELSVLQIPIVDKSGAIVDLYVSDSLYSGGIENPVVLMAVA